GEAQVAAAPPERRHPATLTVAGRARRWEHRKMDGDDPKGQDDARRRALGREAGTEPDPGAPPFGTGTAAGVGAAEGPAAGAIEGDHAFFGHPRGLLTLFTTELWERF